MSNSIKCFVENKPLEDLEEKPLEDLEEKQNKNPQALITKSDWVLQTCFQGKQN